MVGAMATAITKSLGTCKARRAPLAPETVAGPMATSHGGPATVDALAPRLFAALGAIDALCLLNPIPAYLWEKRSPWRSVGSVECHCSIVT